MNVPFEVICINDSHRPAEVPTSQWIKKGEHIFWYTAPIEIDLTHIPEEIKLQLNEST